MHYYRMTERHAQHVGDMFHPTCPLQLVRIADLYRNVATEQLGTLAHQCQKRFWKTNGLSFECTTLRSCEELARIMQMFSCRGKGNKYYTHAHGIGWFYAIKFRSEHTHVHPPVCSS